MNEQADEVKSLLMMKNREPQNLRIESDVLEPQSISQKTATFNIRRAGILSNGSRVILPLYATNGTTRLCSYAGAFAKCLNATLKTSEGVVIAQTTDANYLMSIRNHYVSQETREKRGQLVNGCYNVYAYGDATLANGGNVNGKYLLKTNTDADREARFVVGSSEANATQFSIKLSDLFPSLFPFSIPLFLLNSQLILFLEFSNNASDETGDGEMAVSSTGASGGIGDILIDTAKCKFVSDHLFYDGGTMAKLQSVASSNNGLVQAYGDYNTIRLTQKCPTAIIGARDTTQQVYRNSIGMANLKIKNMLIHSQLQKADGTLADSQKIAGKYASQDSYVGKGGQQLQIQINNENYYPQDITSQEFYKELEDVYGVAPSIPFPYYTCMGGVGDEKNKTIGGVDYLNTLSPNLCLIGNSNFYATAENTQLGNANIIGINFTHDRINNAGVGKEVGIAPVEIRYTRSWTASDQLGVATTNLLQRVFVEVERVMAIKNGMVFNNYS
jgi:hypothetical protein